MPVRFGIMANHRLGLFSLLLAAVASAADEIPPSSASPATMIGVNLAGAEFGKVPGQHGRDYGYPGAASFDYFKARGLTLIRLPFKWERIQPALMGPLDDAELKRLDATVALARERDMVLLLDLHNYGNYGKAALGTDALPNAALADVWKRLAEHFANERAVFAYGLMNEPVGAKERWPAAAQAAIDAIRTVDTHHTISVCGGGFSGAHAWKRASAGFPLRDPASNLVYEAHQYFDRDHSGAYKQGYDDSGACPTTGVQRLQPFIAWLQANHARGFLGEFGVPGDDPRWLEVLDHTLAELKANGIGGTYWAAGPRWGPYPLSVEPRDGRDRPQMEVLTLYAGDRRRPADAKTSYDDAAAKMKAAGRKLVFNFRSRAEAYHYANKETTYGSELVGDAGRDARRISYRHAGQPAYVGLGLFFGALDCTDRTGFVLAIRAAKSTSLDVKVFAPDKSVYTARFPVAAEWQELAIPFHALRGTQGGFESVRVVEKIEFQPAPDTAGNSLLLGEFMLAK